MRTAASVPEGEAEMGRGVNVLNRKLNGAVRIVADGRGDSGNGGHKAAETFRAPHFPSLDGAHAVVFDAALDADGENELRPPPAFRR